MMKRHGLPQRKPLRLHGFDYRSAGAYFVTICVQGRMCLFGAVENGALQCNEAGQIVTATWLALPARFAGVTLDAWVVMPNHMHGIVWLGEGAAGDGDDAGRDEDEVRPYDGGSQSSAGDAGRDEDEVRPIGSMRGRGEPGVRPDHQKRPLGTAPHSLGRVVQAFKSITTHQYTVGVRENGWPPFQRRLWQRNYYDHIIRNEADLNRIRAYIANNPAQWELDQLHPDNPSKW